MLRYMQALAKVVVKTPVVWIVLVVCQAMFLEPFVTSGPTWGDHLGQEFYRESRLEPMEQSWATGYPGMDEQQLQEIEHELELIRSACATDSQREYFELRAEIAAMDERGVQNRTLSGPSLLEAQSEKIFFTRLSELDDPQVYLTYREAPMWFYLAANHATVPILMWLLPGLIASFVVLHAARGKQLLAQAPVGMFSSHAAQFLVAFAFAAVSMALVALPAAVVTAVVNGFGDASYPVVNATRSLLLDLTAGEVLLRAVALYIGASLYGIAAMFAIAAFLPYAWLGVATLAVAAVCAQPLVTDYVELQNVWTGQTNVPLSVDHNLDGRGNLQLYSPLTYLKDGSEAAGYANYYPAVEQTVDDRLTVGLGVAVFAGWSVALCAVDAGVLVWKKTRIGRFDSGADKLGKRASDGLTAQSLTIAHGKQVLMKDATIFLKSGEVVGLVAPNGRGKTTLIEALVGANGARRAGAVHMDGTSLAKRAGFFQNVLYVPCDAKLLYGNLSAADHIKFASTLWRKRVDVDKLIDYCGIRSYMNKPVAFCSSGMKQQIALAVAYCTGVRYLLLDEPMNALDPSNVSLNSTILERLASQGHGILLSSHILSNLEEVCTSVVFIEGDNLVKHAVDNEGGVEELYEEAYGAPELGRHMKKGGRS